MTAIEATRDSLITSLQALVTLIGGLSCAAVIWALRSRAPTIGDGIVKLLASVIPFSDKLEKTLGTGVAEHLAAPVIAFVGGAWLTWKARGLIRWIVNRLFPPFDTTLLRPIRRAGSLDPLWLPPIGADRGMQPLPWVTPPRDSPRRAVWDTLIAFLSHDTGDGRFTLLGRPGTPFVRFRWTMLTGRPGSGKTRMATELARFRARREVLGHDTTETRADRQRLRRGAWLRLNWPFVARREGTTASVGSPWPDADPWDAGWVVASLEPGGIQHGHRPLFDLGLLDQWRAWRPRRPTVLILDDPRAGDAQAVITALLGGEARYRHPVRLIVANQSLPEDLGFDQQSDKSWAAKLRGFAAPVLSLDGAASLSAAEVRMMAGVLRLSGHGSGWKPNDDNVRRLLRRTRANALLVCLELQQIQRRPEAGMASLDDLLLDRAGRISEALKAAGIGDRDHLRAIAWATLIEGTEGVAPPSAGGWPGTWPRFEPEHVTMLPNLDTPWPSPMPPLVRPEQIGDGFVRFVLSSGHCDPDTRQAVIAAAWRANPLGVLQTARRRSAGVDEVAAALRAGPPPNAGVAPLDLALAYATAAMLIPRPDWDVGEAPTAGPVLRVALRRIRALSPADAAAAFAHLAVLADVSNATGMIHGRPALACLCAAIRRGLQDEQTWRTAGAAARARSALLRVVEVLPQWSINRYRQLHGPAARAIGGLADRLLASPDAAIGEDWLDRLAEGAWGGGFAAGGFAASSFTAAVLLALSRCRAEPGDTSTLATARRFRFAAMAAALREDRESCGWAASALDDLTLRFGGDRGFELERTRGWRCVAFARRNTIACCEAAARQVDDLARSFAGDRDFELERTRAWRSVAFAHNDITGRETVARAVDGLARPFAGDHDFELERTGVWRSVAYAHRNDIAGCKAAARHVDDLARPYAGDRSFELERIRAWRFVALAHSDNVAGCEAAARHVDDLARPFAGDRDFELERMRARCFIASASRDGVASCELAARQVDDLARPFAGDRDFELERTQARCFVAYAHRNDISGCMIAACEVDNLARPFAGDRDFEFERTRVWRYVAFAHRDNVACCEAAARHVDDLARPFGGDRNFELERTRAWLYVAFAHHNNIACCEAASRHVDDLARPFAGDRDFEFERTGARGCVVYAHRNDIADCEAAARQVDDLARPFIGDPAFERTRTQAWSHLNKPPPMHPTIVAAGLPKALRSE